MAAVVVALPLALMLSSCDQPTSVAIGEDPGTAMYPEPDASVEATDTRLTDSRGNEWSRVVLTDFAKTEAISECVAQYQPDDKTDADALCGIVPQAMQFVLDHAIDGPGTLVSEDAVPSTEPYLTQETDHFHPSIPRFVEYASQGNQTNKLMISGAVQDQDFGARLLDVEFMMGSSRIISLSGDDSPETEQSARDIIQTINEGTSQSPGYMPYVTVTIDPEIEYAYQLGVEAGTWPLQYTVGLFKESPEDELSFKLIDPKSLADADNPFSLS